MIRDAKIPEGYIVLSSDRVVTAHSPIMCSITFGPPRLPQLLQSGVSLDTVRELGVEKAEEAYERLVKELRAKCIRIDMSYETFKDLQRYMTYERSSASVHSTKATDYDGR